MDNPFSYTGIVKGDALVTRSLEKLVGDDIVLKSDDYKIQDVMFKRWIRTFLLR